MNVRFVVYSYLSVEETANCASMSRQERKNLLESSLARENKVFKIEFKLPLRRECMLHGDLLKKFYTMIEARVGYAD